MSQIKSALCRLNPVELYDTKVSISWAGVDIVEEAVGDIPPTLAKSIVPPSRVCNAIPTTD